MTRESMTINPAEKAKLKTMLVEITHCLQRMDDERESIKDIAAAAEEKTGVPKKLINKVARTMYKHNYQDLQNENEHFEYLYESLVENKNN